MDVKRGADGQPMAKSFRTNGGGLMPADSLLNPAPGETKRKKDTKRLSKAKKANCEKADKVPGA